MWCYSCFAFESMNGHLKKLFHGSRNMNEQCVFRLVYSHCSNLIRLQVQPLDEYVDIYSSHIFSLTFASAGLLVHS